MKASVFKKERIYACVIGNTIVDIVLLNQKYFDIIVINLMIYLFL